MKHRLRVIGCLIFLLVFLSSVIVTPAFGYLNSSQYDQVNSNEETPETPILVNSNLTSILTNLGYTHSNISSIPVDLLMQLLRSQNYALDTNQDDIQAALNDTFLNLPTEGIQGLNNSTSALSADQSSGNTMNANSESSHHSACLIVAIWHYPVPDSVAADLTQWIEPLYNNLVGNVTDYGNYNKVVTMCQSQATFLNVTEELSSLCSSYNNVDLYVFGHGYEFPLGGNLGFGIGTYACWDSISPLDELIGTNLWFPYQIDSSFPDPFSTQPYLTFTDYSTLRMSVFGCCYGGAFEDYCLNPGGSTVHDRAFMGGPGEVSAPYHEDFMNTFVPAWYSGHSSYSSYSIAYGQAYNNIDGYTPYDYSDTDNNEGIFANQMNLFVGVSSALSIDISSLISSFPQYYDGLPGITCPIGSIIETQDNDHNVFAGVMSGLYDVGFVDRLPNPGEYNSNTQLYAVGYQGDWSYGTGQALPLSNVIWMVTDNCIIYKNSPQMADGLIG